MAVRVSVSLLSVLSLQSILNNVSLSLPSDYSLLVGNILNTIPSYYSHTQVALLADTQGFVLVLSLPLTVSNRNYEIYEIVTFPTQILITTYVIYHLNKVYLAVSTPNFTHVTLSESDLDKCEGGMFKYCPADKAVIPG
jgi:hypothetical protein